MCPLWIKHRAHVPVGAATAGAQCWQGHEHQRPPAHHPQMREWVKCHPVGSLQIESEVLHIQNKNRKLYQGHSVYKKELLKIKDLIVEM